MCVYTPRWHIYITRQLYLLNRLLVTLKFYTFIPTCTQQITTFFVHYRSTAAVYRVLLFFFKIENIFFIFFLKKKTYVWRVTINRTYITFMCTHVCVYSSIGGTPSSTHTVRFVHTYMNVCSRHTVHTYIHTYYSTHIVHSTWMHTVVHTRDTSPSLKINSIFVFFDCVDRLVVRTIF